MSLRKHLVLSVNLMFVNIQKWTDFERLFLIIFLAHGYLIRLINIIKICSFMDYLRLVKFLLEVFFFLIYFFYFCSSTLVSIFIPQCSHCPTHPSFLSSILPPLALSMCPLYMFLDGPLPIFPHYPSPPSFLVTVSLL